MTLIAVVNENTYQLPKPHNASARDRLARSSEMPTMKPLRIAVLAALLALPPMAAAQPALEVISLRHSTVDQVLPALRPLLEPGGTLAGQSGQLIVRTSPGNLEEIRQALAAIDRPRRRLQISVRFDDASGEERRAVEAGGRIGDRGSRVDISAGDARSTSSSRINQRVQVVEGGRAVILFGESRPMAVRERIQTPLGPVGEDRIVMRETTTGFEVVPRLAGERVHLDIAPQRERFVGSGGAVDSQRLATTASAALGEWFEIGGAVEHAMASSGGIASMSRSRSGVARRIWVRVDEAGR
jgi:hypothetical protein